MPGAGPIAVLIPGIMGSCLEAPQDSGDVPDEEFLGEERRGSQRRKVIWSEDAFQIYRLLLKRPSALKYVGIRAEPTKILKTVRLWRLPARRLYSRLDRLLQRHEAFRQPGHIVEFPYDWRADLLDTAGVLGTHLSLSFGNVASEGERQLVFVTHSMGGLIARIAITTGRVHASRVHAIVHLAPPLLGSPKAFRAVYAGDALPMLPELVQLFYKLKRGRDALRVMCDAIASFPSIYQLMPPAKAPFLELRGGDLLSPFDGSDRVVPADMKRAAKRAHAELGKFPRLARQHGIKVHSVIGVRGAESTDQTYRVFDEKTRYSILKRLTTDDGDDTVTAHSATRGGKESRLAGPVLGAEHSRICDNEDAMEVLGTILQRGLWSAVGTTP